MINESKVPKLPLGIKPSYLNKNTIEYKQFDMVDDGELFRCGAWFGKVGKTEKYSVIFYSFDFGAQAKIISGSEKEMKDVFDYFVNKISYDSVLKKMNK